MVRRPTYPFVQIFLKEPVLPADAVIIFQISPVIVVIVADLGGVGAVGGQHDGVWNDAGDLVQTRFPPDLLIGDDLLTADDDPAASKGHIQVVEHCALNAAGAVRRGFLYVDQGHVDVRNGDIAKLVPGMEGVICNHALLRRQLGMLGPDLFADAHFFGEVAAQHVLYGNEREAQRGRVIQRGVNVQRVVLQQDTAFFHILAVAAGDVGITGVRAVGVDVGGAAVCADEHVGVAA